MTTKEQADSFYGESGNYVAKLRQFTPNAWMVLLHNGFSGMLFGIFFLLFNFYVLSLGGYDETFLGSLISVSSVAQLLMALPAAYIVQRFSQKWVMVVATLVNALVYLGIVLLPYRGALIALNFIAGAAMTMRWVAVAPFLMDNTSERERQYVFSFSFGLSLVTQFAGSLLGGYLPTWLGGFLGAGPQDTLSYQLALGSLVLLSILTIVPLLAIRIKAREPGPAPEIEMPWTQLREHGRILAKLNLPLLILGLGAGLMAPFMNLYYRMVFGKSDEAIGTLFAMGALAMAVAQFTSAPLADRWGKIRTTVFSQLFSIPFLLYLGLAAWAVPSGKVNVGFWFALSGLAYLVRLALMNLGSPVYQTFGLEMVEPKVQALAASLENITFQFGWAVGPILSGWLQARYAGRGFLMAFLITTVMYVLSIGITWRFFHDAEKKRLPLPEQGV